MPAASRRLRHVVFNRVQNIFVRVCAIQAGDPPKSVFTRQESGEALLYYLNTETDKGSQIAEMVNLDKVRMLEPVCRFAWGEVDVINSVSNLRVRRNVFLGNYVQNPDGSKTKGLKASNLYISNRGHPFTVEENIFDYGGWLPSGTLARCGRVVLSHNLYASSHAGPGLVRRNIFCRGALQGAMLRGGGVQEDNLYVECAVACVVGTRASDLRDNVCLSGADISADPDDARGYGPEVRQCPGVTIDGNIIANKSGGVGGGPALNLEYRSTAPWIAGEPPMQAAQNPPIVLTDNVVYDWDGGVRVKMYDGRLTATGNVFCNFNAAHPINLDVTTGTLALSGNKYYNTADADEQMKLNGSLMSFDDWRAATHDTSVFAEQEYDDPARNVESYNDSIGGTADLDDFMDAAKAQWRENWDSDLQATAVNPYIRTGFVPA